MTLPELQSRASRPEEAGHGLPGVHIVIANLKRNGIRQIRRRSDKLHVSSRGGWMVCATVRVAVAWPGSADEADSDICGGGAGALPLSPRATANPAPDFGKYYEIYSRPQVRREHLLLQSLCRWLGNSASTSSRECLPKRSRGCLPEPSSLRASVLVQPGPWHQLQITKGFGLRDGTAGLPAPSSRCGAVPDVAPIRPPLTRARGCCPHAQSRHCNRCDGLTAA